MTLKERIAQLEARVAFLEARLAQVQQPQPQEPFPTYYPPYLPPQYQKPPWYPPYEITCEDQSVTVSGGWLP